MSIHWEFGPTDVQGMLHHFEMVKGCHVSGKDGIEYNYQFRRLRSRNSDTMWGESNNVLVNPLLWMEEGVGYC